MGKNNKANRTKGNTKPSSSDRSAQLLTLNTQALSGFIGFGKCEKESAGYIPVTGQQSTDTADTTVDSDFRMVMRKMLKIDPVTRLKAMEEFGEHCNSKEKDVVKAILPYWPRLYNKLALDPDRRLREATHQANGKLLSKVKQDMAPYLKSIMGVWLVGQCDLYPPAASAAQNLFATIFSNAKQAEALKFCKAEIFSYLKDNLFEQTAKTLSDPNSVSAEDMEYKYNLIISATLQALKKYLTFVENLDLEHIHDDFHSIVSNNKFWKFAKSKEVQIRGAWYALISTICQTKPDLFIGMEKKCAAAVFGCLSESDPTVAPIIWECALSIVMKFENCWQHLDLHKIVLPQLWIFLKEGGKGNAQVLYPCLLPFLSKLPEALIESEDFSLQFFSCVNQSLVLPSVKLSSSECDAIVTAFFECLQFVSCTQSSQSEKRIHLLKAVLTSEVLPLLESSLYQKSHSHLGVSLFYPCLVTLIWKIESLSRNLNNEFSESFSRVLDDFWESCIKVFMKLFTQSSSEREKSLGLFSYFFHCLLNSATHRPERKMQMVRFKDESENVDQKSDEDTQLSLVTQDTQSSLVTQDTQSSLVTQDTQPSLVTQDTQLSLVTQDTQPSLVTQDTQSSLVIQDLVADTDHNPVCLDRVKTITINHVFEFCKVLLKELVDTYDISYLRLFQEMVSPNIEDSLVNELLKTLSVTFECDPDHPSAFVKFLVEKWTSKVKEKSTGLRAIIPTVLYICSHMDKAEAWEVFEGFLNMPVDIFELLYCVGLKMHQEAPFFHEWLSQSTWGTKLLEKLEQHTQGKYINYDCSAHSEVQAVFRIFANIYLKDLEDPFIDDINFKRFLKLCCDLAHHLRHVDLNNISRVEMLFRHMQSILQEEKNWKFKETEELALEWNMAWFNVPYFRDEFSSKRENPPINQHLLLSSTIEMYIRSNTRFLEDTGFMYRLLSSLNTKLCCLQTKEEAEFLKDTCKRAVFHLIKAYLEVFPVECCDHPDTESCDRPYPESCDIPATESDDIPGIRRSIIPAIVHKALDVLIPSAEFWHSLTQQLSMDCLPLFLKKKIFYNLPLDPPNPSSASDLLKFSLASEVCQSILFDPFTFEGLYVTEPRIYGTHVRRCLPYFLWCWESRKSHEGQYEESAYPAYDKLEENSICLMPHFDINLGCFEDLLLRCTKDASWSVILELWLEKTADRKNPEWRKILFQKYSTLFSENMSEALVNPPTIDSAEDVNKCILLALLSAHKLVTGPDNFSEVLQDLYEHIDSDKEGSIMKLNTLFNLMLYPRCHSLDEMKYFDLVTNPREAYSLDDKTKLNFVLTTFINYDFKNSRDLKRKFDLILACILQLSVQCKHFKEESPENTYSCIEPNVWIYGNNLLSYLLKKSKSRAFSTARDLMDMYIISILLPAIGEYSDLWQQNTDGGECPLKITAETTKDMIDLFIHISDIFKESKNIPFRTVFVLNSLPSILSSLPLDAMKLVLMPGAPGDVTCKEIEETSLFHKLVWLLTSSRWQLQLGSHTLLNRFMPVLVELSSIERILLEDDEDENTPKLPIRLSPLIKIIQHLDEIIDNMLLELKLGDNCTVIPGTDSYTFAMAYLFAWIEVLEFLSMSPSEARSGYAIALESMGLISALLLNVFRFMPQNPGQTFKEKELKALFLDRPAFEPESSSGDLQKAACYVFASALRSVPASVRTWWNNLDRKSADVVESYASTNISGYLCTTEIDMVNTSKEQYENLTILVHPPSRRVIATYTIEECSIDLSIQLPVNYPLGPVIVERRGKSGIGETKWRHWLMQLTTVLTYQNGSILDGLRLWKRNLDKRFEGVEECMICYYVLHNSTLQLPKLSCQVCRKKFHSTCLYKWFNTSNNSLCPLCRNEFRR